MENDKFLNESGIPESKTSMSMTPPKDCLPRPEDESKASQVSLQGLIRLEAASLLGRLILNRKPPVVESGPRLLNLGCGPNLYEGFVNADFFAFRARASRKGLWMLDLRHRLNSADAYWDGVYSEHTLEHLYPNEALFLMQEVHRTLKAGAWVRLIVPDLGKYVRYYCGEASHPLFSRWQERAEALRNVSQCHFHHSLWDRSLLSACLRKAGFGIVVEREFGVGADPRLIKDSENRRWESLYVEAQKSA
jgi:predicted SAM-dependent methyltransferase